MARLIRHRSISRFETSLRYTYKVIQEQVNSGETFTFRRFTEKVTDQVGFDIWWNITVYCFYPSRKTKTAEDIGLDDFMLVPQPCQ